MIRLKTPSNKDICCFVAKTAHQRSSGLNGWGKIPKGSGLLFDFPEPDYVVFHMDKVWYPIDIVFLDKNANVVNVFQNCQPGSVEKYPGYDVKWVLELPANDTARLGIGVGTSLRAYDGLYKFDQKLSPELLAIHAAYNGHVEGGHAYGACIAHGSTPVAWGWNKCKVTGNPTHHAEMICISDAKARGTSLKGARMACTHQPCMMCAGACAWSELSEVTWAIPTSETTIRNISEFLGSVPPKMSYIIS